jgi:tight adherence protein C
MVRSLRFGTSIAESLEASAAEARETHKARMEERVAKVAVKMMLPVGGLILPAMLLLVLGPVLLELMEGF